MIASQVSFQFLNTINHLSLKLVIIVGILQVLKNLKFLKFRILEILNFHPCLWHMPAVKAQRSMYSRVFTAGTHMEELQMKYTVRHKLSIA